jgi:hypothetical protein
VSTHSLFPAISISYDLAVSALAARARAGMAANNMAADEHEKRAMKNKDARIM